MKRLRTIQSAAVSIVRIDKNRVQTFRNSGARRVDEEDEEESSDDSLGSHSFDLNLMCATTRHDEPEEWEKVRDWLRRHTPDQIKEGLLYQGDADMTALHYICRVDPPLDIVETMCEHGEEALEYPDSFGWVPLHYACACSASDEVIETLLEVAPEGKTIVDRKGRAPLHFALHNKRPLTNELVSNLSSTGAAAYPDNQGKLPLHYACDYRCDHQIVQTLIDIFPDGLVALDEKGQSPLLFCLANCDTDYGAQSVRYMLELKKDLVNRYKGDVVPLHALAHRAYHIRSDDAHGQSNAAKCLEHYMGAEPIPTADLTSALQQLPEWLLERAVRLSAVQTLLNQKIVQPFPTAVLMLDFFIICVMGFNFNTLILQSIKLRADDDPDNDALGLARVVPLYVGASYFFTRESIQFIGQASLGAFSTYLSDPTNTLDVLYISSVVYWGVLMQTGAGDKSIFQTGTALTAGLVWTNVMSYLKNVIIDLAIFVAGVTYVVKRLYAFLLAIAIILVAFAHVFWTLRRKSEYCLTASDEMDLNDLRCGTDDDRPFCNFWFSIVRVINMMLGAVDDQEFIDTTVGLFYFVIFIFMVVILLANVLIAIVTDAYGVVRDERAAVVFWFNRLDFVAEMDAIAHGPWTRRLRRLCGCAVGDDHEEIFLQSNTKSAFGSLTWSTLMDIFEEEIGGSHGWCSTLSWKLFLVRVVVAFIIVPLWLLLGLVTMGTLWPPQLREYFFIELIATKLARGGRFDPEKQRDLHVESIENELEEMQDELVQDLNMDRTQLVQVKTQLTEFKVDIANEIREMKERLSDTISAARRANELECGVDAGASRPTHQTHRLHHHRAHERTPSSASTLLNPYDPDVTDLIPSSLPDNLLERNHQSHGFLGGIFHHRQHGSFEDRHSDGEHLHRSGSTEHSNNENNPRSHSHNNLLSRLRGRSQRRQNSSDSHDEIATDEGQFAFRWTRHATSPASHRSVSSDGELLRSNSVAGGFRRRLVPRGTSFGASSARSRGNASEENHNAPRTNHLATHAHQRGRGEQSDRVSLRSSSERR